MKHNVAVKIRVPCLLLFRDDLIFDLLVRRFWNNILLNQLVLTLVRPPINDLLGVGLTDPWQCFELLSSGRIDVERFGGILGERAKEFRERTLIPNASTAQMVGTTARRLSNVMPAEGLTVGETNNKTTLQLNIRLRDDR